jgi:hypothetical protein
MYEQLEDEHVSFIGNQHIFFVGTAGAEGTVNVSPKGMDSFRVLDKSRIAWLNLTGSGNETAAHILENGRMTIMFCSFDKQPLIMRLYGQAMAVHPRDEQWRDLESLFPIYTGARQIFVQDIDLVQTSCGYAVPHYELKSERHTLTKWADNKGREGVEEYWCEKNLESIDGKDTGLFQAD